MYFPRAKRISHTPPRGASMPSSTSLTTLPTPAPLPQSARIRFHCSAGVALARADPSDVRPFRIPALSAKRSRIHQLRVYRCHLAGEASMPPHALTGGRARLARHRASKPRCHSPAIRLAFFGVDPFRLSVLCSRAPPQISAKGVSPPQTKGRKIR